MNPMEIDMFLKKLQDEVDKILAEIKKNPDEKEDIKKMKKQMVAINNYIIATIKFKNQMDTL
jgi:hypothetical protein